MFGAGQMRKASGFAAMVATILPGGAAASLAGPWEDGMVAYNREASGYRDCAY